MSVSAVVRKKRSASCPHDEISQRGQAPVRGQIARGREERPGWSRGGKQTPHASF